MFKECLFFYTPGQETKTSFLVWLLPTILSHANRLLLLLIGGLAETGTDEEFRSWFAKLSNWGSDFCWKPVLSGASSKALWYWINDSKFCFIFHLSPLLWHSPLALLFKYLENFSLLAKILMFSLNFYVWKVKFISSKMKVVYGLLLISLLEDKRRGSCLFFLRCSAVSSWSAT